MFERPMIEAELIKSFYQVEKEDIPAPLPKVAPTQVI